MFVRHTAHKHSREAQTNTTPLSHSVPLNPHGLTQIIDYIKH